MEHGSFSTSALHRAQQASVLALGCGLLAYGLTRRTSPGSLGAGALALPLLYAGIAGTDAWSRRNDTRSALRGSRGIHLRESVRVGRPVAEVYREWKRLEHLPAMMSGLEQVETGAGDRSRWLARGPGNLPVQWEAEVINDEPEQVIGWKTLPGSDVQCAGSVRFDAAPGDRGTQITVHLQYAPPAGRVGAALARLSGHDPAHQVREGLRQFKQTLEAGERPRVAAATGELA